MADEKKPLLRCDVCGKSPTPEQAKWCAQVGGTHFRELTHGSGIPGRESKKLRTCGTWVEVKP